IVKGSALSLSIVDNALYVDGTAGGNFGVTADFSSFFGGTLQTNFQISADFNNSGGTTVQSRLFALATDGSGNTGYTLQCLGDRLRIMKNGAEVSAVTFDNNGHPYILTLTGTYNTDGSLTLTGKKNITGDGVVETVSYTDTSVLTDTMFGVGGRLSNASAIVVSDNFTVQAIPEPATLGLLGISGVVVVFLRRCCKKQA
ncbi:MAG: PEP-CTERM sorting domain-containing protein, partial [Kiritimatiellales bacterium]